MRGWHDVVLDESPFANDDNHCLLAVTTSCVWSLPGQCVCYGLLSHHINTYLRWLLENIRSNLRFFCMYYYTVICFDFNTNGIWGAWQAMTLLNFWCEIYITLGLMSVCVRACPCVCVCVGVCFWCGNGMIGVVCCKLIAWLAKVKNKEWGINDDDWECEGCSRVNVWIWL